MPLYLPPQAEHWQGRTDQEEHSQHIHEVVKLLNLAKLGQSTDSSSSPQPPKAQGKKIALLGFAVDEGIIRNQGRPGAKQGPVAIRQQLAKQCVHFAHPFLQLYDVGDVIYDPADTQGSLSIDPLAASQQQLCEFIKRLVRDSFFPIVMGGGHELALGHFMGHFEVLRQQSTTKKIGIINLDAHFDMRPPIPQHSKAPRSPSLGHSGSPFFQIQQQIGRNDFHYLCLGVQKSANSKALFQTAEAVGVEYIEAEQLIAANPAVMSRLHAFVAGVDCYYLSICLDSFNAAYAPGVSAVNHFGLVPQIILPYLDFLMSHPKIIGFDIAELSPPYDDRDRTAGLAAWLVQRQIHALH